MWSLVSFFVFLKYLFCFVVAVFDQVLDVVAIFHLPEMLTSSENIFLKYE